MLNFVLFCYWKGAKFAENILIFGQFCVCVIHALSESESFCVLGAGQVLRCKDSLPFPRKKIDSGLLWHNFGIFTHTEVWVFLLFFFFFLFFF